jgi:hypothetical protein
MTQEVFNIYCDESGHLERDDVPVMVLGAVWCRASAAQSLARRIRDIVIHHGLAADFEIKWTKVSRSKQEFYEALIEYFFDEPELHFRGVLIPDKAKLNHAEFDQTHDEWYYKMLYTVLDPIIDPRQRYRIYLDIKDTRSEQRRAKLEEVLRSARHDSHGQVVERIQQIRSHESRLLQMADLLIGAIGYHNRHLTSNAGKLAVVRRIQRRSGWPLDSTTWLREPKLSLLRWQARESGV